MNLPSGQETQTGEEDASLLHTEPDDEYPDPKKRRALAISQRQSFAEALCSEAP